MREDHSRGRGPGPFARLRGFADHPLIGSSAILFVGNSAARLLGLLFSITSARLLLPRDFGLFAYALVIVSVGSILIENAPTGLARFLAMHHGSKFEQDSYFSNSVAVVGTMLAASLLLIVPVSIFGGLKGWMLVGVIANLLGLAAYALYREAQRGLERFVDMVVFYILANFLQLVAIAGLGIAGFHRADLFLIVYGLANVASLIVMQLVAPLSLSFIPRLVVPARLRVIASFTWPLLVQTAFFVVWFGADMILVTRLVSITAAGDYAAAKTLVNIFYLAPAAIGSAISPQIARLHGTPLRRFIVAALGLTLAVTLPLLAVTLALGDQVVRVVFGAKYAHSAEPLPLLAAGMAIYGLYMVMESITVGLGRPKIDAFATAAGALATVVAGLVLVPRWALVGAAAAFAAGSAVQLALIGGYVLSLFWRRDDLHADGPDPSLGPK